MIIVKNLVYRYLKNSEIPTLNDVSFEIRDSKFIIIAGSSGSGKTTLLYALGGLLKPEKGVIIIEEADILKMTQAELADYRNKTVGFVFQNYFLDESLSNLENVYITGLILGKLKKKELVVRAKELLHLVGLTDDEIKRKPNELSGGQQQRVAIARALMNNPKIILADEPTGNLDSKNSKMIMDLLKKISQEEGIQIFLVTHDQSFLSYADLIINLSDGKVISNERQS